MAIYISGVKNLPEQVQKNKDDIEDLQTADTNLDAKIDQAVADRKEIIDASGNATIIENPTENVAVSLSENESTKSFVVFIDGTPKLNIDEHDILANEDTAVNGDLDVSGEIKGNTANIVSNITAGGDITTPAHLQGRYVKATQEIVAKHITTPTDESFLQFTAYDSSQNPHVMQFSGNSQELTIDGQAVGGLALYSHTIYFSRATTGHYIACCVNIISTDSTAYTLDTFKQYLTNKGYTAYNRPLLANGGYYNGAHTYCLNTLFLDSGTIYVGYTDDKVNNNEYSYAMPLADQQTITDHVVAIS